jgi:regulator of nonsense transcripts 3
MRCSLSKPSRLSRVYLHLTSDTYLIPLSEAVHQASFEDTLNTWNSPSLLGPPSVEFAPYARIPSGRRRTDARQGTIDQDPEFMDFLETLANPISIKESTGESTTEVATEKGEKITTTPLVQFLREKKANKGKETVAAKTAKHTRQDSQSAKSTKPSKELPSQEDTKKPAKDSKKEKMLVEKAGREAVKVLSRQAAAKEPATPATAPDPPKHPRVARERGSIAAAARILQRDLGLSPGNAHRKAKADADNAMKAPASSSQPPEVPNPPKASLNKSRGRGQSEDKPQAAIKENPAPSSPILLLKKPAEAMTPNSPTPPVAPANTANKTAAQLPVRKMQPPAVPSAGATRAFVKHANPSQGVTETLLKEAMEAFGAVSHVEIDKRKGFAYVDFVEPESLVKAMAANPTKIAQGTVQVLERKDTKPAREPPTGPASRGGMFPRGRGGGGSRRGARGGRGGSEVASVAPTGPAASTAPGAGASK